MGKDCAAVTFAMDQDNHPASLRPLSLEYQISPEVDDQHRTCFEIMARCRDDGRRGENLTTVAALMAEFLEHIAEHFYTEERLMRRIGVPGFDRHKAEHDAIARAAVALAEQFPAGRLALHDVADFGRNRLLRHLAGSDTVIASFIRQQHV